MLSAQLADEISKKIKGIEPKLAMDDKGQAAYKIPAPVEIKSLGELGNGSEPIFIFICGVKEIKFRDNKRLEPAGCTGLFVYYSKAAAKKREDKKQADIKEQALLEKGRIDARRKALINEEITRLIAEEKEVVGLFDQQDREIKKENLEKIAEDNLKKQGVIKT